MNGDNKNTSDDSPTAAGVPTPDDIEDQLVGAVERSYGASFAAGTDLSPEELKRIREKQAAHVASPDLDRDKQ